jgi:hypothetical protein
VKNLADTGGRWLDISPQRFPGWIASFARRHGGTTPELSLTVAVTSDDVIFTAPDGATAKCQPPFWESQIEVREYGGQDAAHVARLISEHALAERDVAVLLVRLGGYAAGVFTGSPPKLAVSKTGSRLVHGRSAAGGWSQHRFARRREKQAAEALHAAANAAAQIFGGWGVGKDRSGSDVVIFGGDKRAVADTVSDPRLAPYLDLVTSRFLTVPDPRLAVLKDVPRLFLAVRILLREPTADRILFRAFAPPAVACRGIAEIAESLEWCNRDRCQWP